jgi:hypothetical protein
MAILEYSLCELGLNLRATILRGATAHIGAIGDDPQ